MPTTQTDVANLVGSIDRREPDAFGGFLSEDATYRSSNYAPVTGRAAIRQTAADFFSAIAGVEHELLHTVEDGDTVVVQTDVTFTRTDG